MKTVISNLDEALRALDRQIGAAGGSSIGLVVCGGSALAALGLVPRTTRDVDVLAEARPTPSGIRVEQLRVFPSWLVSAAAKVERDLALPHAWLNLGPAAQLTMGLPDGLVERLVAKTTAGFSRSTTSAGLTKCTSSCMPR